MQLAGEPVVANAPSSLDVSRATGGGMAGEGREPRRSSDELRSILQALASKFYSATDVAQIQNVNAMSMRLKEKRAVQLVSSRDALHCKPRLMRSSFCLCTAFGSLKFSDRLVSFFSCLSCARPKRGNRATNRNHSRLLIADSEGPPTEGSA